MDEPTPPDAFASPDPPSGGFASQPVSSPGPPGVWSSSTLDSHITILGALYIAFSVLGILLALGLSMAIIGGGLISGDRDAVTATTLVGGCLGGLLLFISLPGLVGGIYLMKRRRWARILVLVLGFLNLLNIPLGTLLGAYTIWVLLKPEADEAFH